MYSYSWFLNKKEDENEKHFMIIFLYDNFVSEEFVWKKTRWRTIPKMSTLLLLWIFFIWPSW